MKSVTVTVRDGHLEALDEVVQGLQGRGMQVEQVLGSLGIVTGSVPEDALDALRSVEGVASVDEQLTHRVPPPDSPIQ
jgi:hypothetical protein